MGGVLVMKVLPHVALDGPVQPLHYPDLDVTVMKMKKVSPFSLR